MYTINCNEFVHTSVHLKKKLCHVYQKEFFKNSQENFSVKTLDTPTDRHTIQTLRKMITTVPCCTVPYETYVLRILQRTYVRTSRYDRNFLKKKIFFSY